jgi:dihydroorotate dehydrogenase
MYPLFRPLLFRLDPETAHNLTLGLLRLARRLPPALWLLRRIYSAPEKPVEAFGLKFSNPVGLAAGYDKDGLALRGLAALGFGHIEVGTVTPLPQPGNPRPRIFRLVPDGAVINRMGFPGKGMDSVAMSLRQADILSLRKRRSLPVEAIPPSDSLSLRGRRSLPAVAISPLLGVNLGKNKDTPLEEAAEDYLALLRTFLPLADYLAVNISSPNTAGLRRLQGRALLEDLLSRLAAKRSASAIKRPILVKLAPDLDAAELDDALEAIINTGMDGVILTNTTLSRPGLHSAHASEAGGLSGRPLSSLSESLLKTVLRRLEGRLPVVSAGGIMSPEDAQRRLDMGAALVQVYTGLVYAGPSLVRDIVKNL